MCVHIVQVDVYIRHSDYYFHCSSEVTGPILIVCVPLRSVLVAPSEFFVLNEIELCETRRFFRPQFKPNVSISPGVTLGICKFRRYEPTMYTRAFFSVQRQVGSPSDRNTADVCTYARGDTFRDRWYVRPFCLCTSQVFWAR